LDPHIGMDRALGFGLKYETDFKDTHLGRVDAPDQLSQSEADHVGR
jgi:hypothetical protein